MFDLLSKYKKHDHFFLTATDSLDEKCNAPDDSDGVYVIYELKNGRVTLVYIGSSGKKISGYHIEEGLVGIKTAILTDNLSAKTLRSQAWPVKMLSEGIDALDIYWWVTYKGNLKDDPENVKRNLIRIHREMFGESPKWNQKVPKK